MVLFLITDFLNPSLRNLWMGGFRVVAGAAASCDVRFRQNLRICENDCVALILCPGNVSTAARLVSVWQGCAQNF